MADAPIQLNKVTPGDVVAVPTGSVGFFAGSDGKFYAKDGSSAAAEIGALDTEEVQDLIDTSLESRTKWVFTGDIVAAERKVANNVWCYAGANADGNTAGSTCLFGGQASGSAATLVTDSTSWGIWALKSIETGNGNSAFGVYSLRDAVTINGCTAMGDSALMTNQANHCTGIGYGAGSRNITGLGNVFVGSYAGWQGDKGDYNYIEGFYANSYSASTPEAGVTLGDYNWISGYTAAYKFQGNHSRIRGYESAYNWITGSHNFVEGYQAGASVTSGSHAIFIGFLSGSNVLQAATVDNVVCLGRDSYSTKDNQVVLGGAAITETILRGNVVFQGQSWIRSQETLADRDRILFEPRDDANGLGSTYYRGHSLTPHVFQNRDGTSIFRLSTIAEVLLEQLRVQNSGAQIALYKDASPSRAFQLVFSSNQVNLNYFDGTAWRNAIGMNSSGTAAQLGFFSATPIVKPTVSGSRGSNAALDSALTALANLGLITNSTTA